MNNKDIQELIMLAESCRNNMKRKYKGIYDKPVEDKCQKFCKKHNINITHGSAYREVCHKYYYYINKYIVNVIANREDLYDLYKDHILSSKYIIDKILYK
mgnify:CR=1 FL=1